eukprot:scaffold14370_cov126-Isochrysis_galbana.AAC.1
MPVSGYWAYLPPCLWTSSARLSLGVLVAPSTCTTQPARADVSTTTRAAYCSSSPARLCSMYSEKDQPPPPKPRARSSADRDASPGRPPAIPPRPDMPGARWRCRPAGAEAP